MRKFRANKMHRIVAMDSSQTRSLASPSRAARTPKLSRTFSPCVHIRISKSKRIFRRRSGHYNKTDSSRNRRTPRSKPYRGRPASCFRALVVRPPPHCCKMAIKISNRNITLIPRRGRSDWRRSSIFSRIRGKTSQMTSATAKNPTSAIATRRSGR